MIPINAAFNFYICCFHQVIQMHYRGQGNGKIYNLRLQLYIRSGCASWFHGKPKASKDEYYIVLSPSLPPSLILNDTLSSHFLCNQNSGDSKLTYLLMSFLNTPEEASTLSAMLFCWTWYEWTCTGPVAIQLHMDPHTHNSLGKTQSSRMVSWTAVSVWLLGTFVYFLYGFLSWLGQTAPLSCEDNVFPAKRFLQFTSSPGLDFLGWFQLRNWHKN